MAYLPTFFCRKRGPPRIIWHSWAGSISSYFGHRIDLGTRTLECDDDAAELIEIAGDREHTSFRQDSPNSSARAEAPTMITGPGRKMSSRLPQYWYIIER
jgi:hypothetical protein